MNFTFNDHFASVTSHYARFRPTYPDGLFAWLAAAAPDQDLVWDCAAGSGQATLALTRHFKRVIATDASQAQIDAAPSHPNIEYRIAPAEASGLPEAVVALITVAQALHWFDLERFYAEAHRVLKPAGILAAWTYGVLTLDDACIDACVQKFYQKTVGPYWPSERRHVESGYRTLPFPFHEVPVPEFHMATAWTLPELLGYLRSWSATGRYLAVHGTDPVNGLGEELALLWSDPSIRRQITWPLSFRVGRD
ncbi:MAG: class I SAM-dependent methyltransferase [Gammaproteobacteria bacterium]|nr:class I SAM-dependent methyltransferase [Gammaproteobacteria bacterium]